MEQLSLLSTYCDPNNKASLTAALFPNETIDFKEEGQTTAQLGFKSLSETFTYVLYTYAECSFSDFLIVWTTYWKPIICVQLMVLLKHLLCVSHHTRYRRKNDQDKETFLSFY